MPAIDPSRLERQIAHVMEVFDDPRRLHARCLDLLEFYAARVRQGANAGRVGSLRSLGVPSAVTRRLQQALVERALRAPYAGAMAAETLWSSPVLEGRALAVALLECQPVAALPDWVTAWSHTAADPHLLETLAAGPMRRLWRERQDLFWAAVALDLTAEDASTTVALLALEQVIPDLEPDDLPRLFAALEASPVPGAGEAWRAYVAAVRVAVRRSPSEAARFVVDEIEHARPGASRLARQILADFPPRQREAVRQALRLGETSVLAP